MWRSEWRMSSYLSVYLRDRVPILLTLLAELLNNYTITKYKCVCAVNHG